MTQRKKQQETEKEREPKPRSKHHRHLGFTIPAAAEELEVPEGAVRRAAANGEIEFVWFGGLRRIPPREVERLRDLFKEVA
jgi:excisionase family DNA binding protein